VKWSLSNRQTCRNVVVQAKRGQAPDRSVNQIVLRNTYASANCGWLNKLLSLDRDDSHTVPMSRSLRTHIGLVPVQYRSESTAIIFDVQTQSNNQDRVGVGDDADAVPSGVWSRCGQSHAAHGVRHGPGMCGSAEQAMLRLILVVFPPIIATTTRRQHGQMQFINSIE
jgi:hypothetical protein